LIVLAACGSTAPAPVAPVPAAVVQCTYHHVHGTIVDASDKPVGRTHVDLVGQDGQDDTLTDDDGQFDLHSAQPHARLVTAGVQPPLIM
jgi:hypothetical protein